MFLWTIKWVIISIILILLIHNIFTFLKETLTIPKTRDLVSMDARYQELNEYASVPTEEKEPENSKKEKNTMESELKEYLYNIDKSPTTTATNTTVTDIDSIINLNKPD